MSARLPLADVHAAAGATIETVRGWEVPLAYGEAAAEHAAVRTGVGLLDRGDHGTLEVTGKDRASFLHALLSNEVKALAPGQGCAATLLDVHGKVQVVLAVLVLEDRIVLVTPPDAAPATLEALDHYLFSEKAVLEDTTGRHALLMLAGPGAPDLAGRLTGARPGEAAWSHAEGEVDGVPVRAVRGGGETGEAEVWVLAPAAHGRSVWDRAVAAGARPVGLTALESLRIEAGTPRPGVDVDGSVLLPEFASEHLLSHTKGCYPGQEVVVRIRDRGHVNRLFRGLVLEGDAVPAPGAEILGADGATIGRVTSAARSLGLSRPLALGVVRRQAAEPGTPVRVRAGEATLAARVSALPFTR
jgi:folate-binding protein YgfZ